MIRPAASLRGLDQGDYEIFALHFTWGAGMRTSLHKHKGFELVLQKPPEGTSFTTEAEMDELRTLSQTLIPG